MTVPVPPTTPGAPPTAPQRSEPSTFSARMDAWLTWFNASFWPWLYDLVPWIQASANEVEANAATVTLTAGAEMWVPSTFYAQGKSAIRPTDFQTIRRNTAGTSASTYTADATNWTVIAAVPDSSVTTAKIADSSVTTAKIADSSVTTAKIAYSSVTTSNIANDAVTFAKLQNISTAQLLGRNTGGTGDVEQLSPSTARTMLGLAAIATSGSGADITTGDIPAARIASALNATGAAPFFACRAWVNFNGTGTVAIRASGNVSSITDNGVGDYTVNFTTAMPDANYSTVSNCSWTADTGAVVTSAYPGKTAAPQTTSSVRIKTVYIFSGVTAFDPPFVNVAIFR